MCGRVGQAALQILPNAEIYRDVPIALHQVDELRNQRLYGRGATSASAERAVLCLQFGRQPLPMVDQARLALGVDLAVGRSASLLTAHFLDLGTLDPGTTFDQLLELTIATEV